MSRRSDYGEQSDRTAALQPVTNSARFKVFPDVPQHYLRGPGGAHCHESTEARAGIDPALHTEIRTTNPTGPSP